MKTDFDCIIDRRGSGCSKWDGLKTHFGRTDILPLWVADTDFAAPPAVIEALNRVTGHSVLGYPVTADAFFASAARWLENRHNWTVDCSWLKTTPGVVYALNLIVQTLTKPDDNIIIQTPVYPPFFNCVTNNHRRLLENPLINDAGYYRMDFNHFECLCQNHQPKMFIFCSPHNPVGRCWTLTELNTLAALCSKYNVIILSDEIHSDLTLNTNRHIPIASLPAVAGQTITCMAPSKTFNIAGLFTALTITANTEFNKALQQSTNCIGLPVGNIYGLAAGEAAYNNCGSWLDELLIYLQYNAEFLADSINNIPGLNLMTPEATFLAWLDCRQLGIPDEDLPAFFINEAKLALNSGSGFGQNGNGFMRLNFGCPHSVLTKAIEQIATAIENHQ